MNLQITGKAFLLIAFLLLFSSTVAFSQVAVANPVEWAVLAEGNEFISGKIKDEVGAKVKIASLQGTIAAEFTKIKKWQQKYNSYLKEVDGYASSLKAATFIYNDGVRLFMNLCELKAAVTTNPEGVAASMSMNNLFMETAEELVSVYTILKEVVAKGGKENMLSGAERSEMLWMIEDRLKSFNHKLSKLTLSLRYYTLLDVWDNKTLAAVSLSNAEIASRAKRRWIRSAKIH